MIIILLTFGICGSLLTAEEKIRLAVSQFDDSNTEATENIRAGAAITDIIEKKYCQIDHIQVRKSNAIKCYLDCLAKVQLGLNDPNLVKGKAESLKIDYLTVGTVSKFEDQYEIDARTVNINDWKIIHSRGCTKYNISGAMDEITWYMSEQCTPRYIHERETDIIKKPTISVLKFSDENDRAVSIGYSGAFSEILNSELGSYCLITTIERTYTKALLNEKALEMAGIIENDGSNGIFNIRGIEYKLAGEMRVLDDMICINYGVYNTTDGRMIFMGIQEIASCRGLRPAAREIALTVEDLLNNRIGTLKLQTVPGNAEVFINEIHSGVSPLVISLPKGNHRLSIKCEGYETYKTDITIKSKEVQDTVIELVPLSMKIIEEAYKFEKNQMWEQAVDAYSRFIGQYGDTAQADSALYRKGHIEMINLKKYDDAIRTFQTLVDRYPETMTRAEAYYGLARVNYLKGNKKEAKKILNYLLEKYSDTYAAEEARKVMDRF